MQPLVRLISLDFLLGLVQHSIDERPRHRGALGSGCSCITASTGATASQLGDTLDRLQQLLLALHGLEQKVGGLLQIVASAL